MSSLSPWVAMPKCSTRHLLCRDLEEKSVRLVLTGKTENQVHRAVLDSLVRLGLRERGGPGVIPDHEAQLETSAFKDQLDSQGTMAIQVYQAHLVFQVPLDPQGIP